MERSRFGIAWNFILFTSAKQKNAALQLLLYVKNWIAVRAVVYFANDDHWSVDFLNLSHRN